LWEGDAVEWYFDTRRDEHFRGMNWGKGAVHCYWTGLKGTNVQPRFCLRPGYLDAIPKIGVEVGARRTPEGMDVEFKLPWANFPDFKAKANTVIALDAELCSSDGRERVARGFVYGSPLSVQEPASQAPIQLVDEFESSFWRACGPVLTPIRCDVPWTQKQQARTVAYMALPPTHADEIGQLLFRLVDTSGKTILEKPGQIESFSQDGSFRRASASWDIDAAPPGTFNLLGIVLDHAGRELTRVAPRMVSVNMNPGY
jgi:hypothetical protein